MRLFYVQYRPDRFLKPVGSNTAKIRKEHKGFNVEAQSSKSPHRLENKNKNQKPKRCT
jgi:hypothetical protein